MGRKRILSTIGDPVMRDLHNWPDISVPSEERDDYDAKRKLLLDWYDNDNVRDVVAAHETTTSALYYWLKSCLKTDRTGQIRGFAGLRKHSGDRTYIRTSTSKRNYSGRFRAFMADHPAIAASVEKAYHNGFVNGSEYGGVLLEKSVLNWFDKLCAKEGIRQDQYPRCLKSKGRTGLNGFLRHLDERRSAKRLKQRDGQVAYTNYLGSEPRDESRLCVYPYREVEVDAQHMDLMMVVLVITPEGVVKPQLIGRCWLYAAIDVASRAIIGYHLSLNEKVTKEDFIECIAKTLRPWKPKTISIPGLYYPEGSGLPSGEVKDCGWRRFSLLRLDNDRIHLSKDTSRKLMETIGCAVHLGKPAVPLGRPFIERFFRTLGELGWHQLPSTTGSDPKSPLRRNPGRAAKKYQISLDEIEQVLDVFIARYNATSTGVSPLYHTSPLQYLENFVLTESLLPCQVPEPIRKRLPMLCDVYRATITGSSLNRRQPVVHWRNAKYKGAALQGAWSLIGKEVDLHYCRDDISKVVATLAETGASIGELLAQPPWHRPHSFRTRLRITKHPCRVDFEDSNDAVLAYQRFVSSRMEESTKAAKEMARMERENSSTRGSHVDPINPDDYFTRQPDFVPSRDDWIEI